MVELTNTNNQLASKVEAIEEEKREMRKKIDEMKLVCDLKAQNDSYQTEISQLEMKIAQLKKALGKTEEKKK